MKPLVSSDYVTRIIRSLEGNQGFAYPGEQDGAILRNAYRGFSGKAGAPYSVFVKGENLSEGITGTHYYFRMQIID